MFLPRRYLTVATLFGFLLLLLVPVSGLETPAAEGACSGMGGGRLPPAPPPPYADPGGGVDPGLRDPSDPAAPTTDPADGEPETPTTPAPDDGPTTSGGGTPAGPSTAGPSAPSAPNAPAAPAAPASPAPGTGGVTTGGSARRPRPAATQNQEYAWTTWWYFNRWSYLPSRNEALREHFVLDRPTTGDGPGPLAVWESRRAGLAEHVAAPPLLKLLTDKLRAPDEPMKGAAALALARLSNTSADVEAILRVAEDPAMIESARRGAVTAAGLLRRTRTDLQMSGARLDDLRKRLLAIHDDDKAPRTVRCIAVMSVGMLSDQPYGDAFPSGLIVTWNLWKRLRAGNRDIEGTVALLTALGLQPAEGIADGVRADLRHIVFGQRVAGRRWNELERSHAFSTLMRLGGPESKSLLLRVLAAKRGIPTAVRRAALISLGAAVEDMSSDQRKDAFRGWDAGRRRSRDPLTKGLATIALGRLLAADLDAGSTSLLTQFRAGETLLKAARNDPNTTRGFAVVALALAARAATGGKRATTKFRRAGEQLFRDGLKSARGDGAARGAHAVAAGLLGMRDTLPMLEAIVEDHNEDKELRGFAAVACGQIGRRNVSTLRALHAALADRGSGPLRQEAALALAYLNGNKEAVVLRQLMARARRHRSEILGSVAMALGQMGDLDAVRLLADTVSHETAQHVARGASAIALGLICDPEETPSLARFWTDVNYPARTAALHEVLNYL